MYQNVIKKLGEDNHQEAFDETEGVREPCQADGASKGLGKLSSTILIMKLLFKFKNCFLVMMTSS